MKKFIFFVFLLLPGLAYARVTSARIDTSVTNLTIHFNGTNGVVPIASMQNITSLIIDNRTATEIAVNCAASPTSAIPSDTSQLNVYEDAAKLTVFPPDSKMGTYCYVRSMSGTISSGIIVITVIGT